MKHNFANAVIFWRTFNTYTSVFVLVALHKLDYLETRVLEMYKKDKDKNLNKSLTSERPGSIKFSMNEIPS